MTTILKNLFRLLDTISSVEPYDWKTYNHPSPSVLIWAQAFLLNSNKKYCTENNFAEFHASVNPS